MNFKQIIALTITTLGVLAVSSANLADLFGAGVAKLVVSAANLLTAILGGWMTILASPSNTLKDAAAMPGVERITVNSQASPTVAAVAVDPTQPKIGGTSPQVQAKLEQTAGV